MLTELSVGKGELQGEKIFLTESLDKIFRFVCLNFKDAVLRNSRRSGHIEKPEESEGLGFNRKKN